MKWFVILAFLWSVGGGLGAAEPVGARFDAANRLYEQGNYTQAATAYATLLQEGFSSSELWFNLGNAHLKAGRIGWAVSAYLKAQQLSPRDPDIRANLQFARDRVNSDSLRQKRWAQAARQLSINEWTVLTAVTFWLAVGLLARIQWNRTQAQKLRIWTAAAWVVFAFFAGCLWLAVASSPARNHRVVVAPEAPVRQGPFEESEAVFTLRDGAQVQVVDTKDDWVRVSVGERKAGWIPRALLAQPGTVPAPSKMK